MATASFFTYKGRLAVEIDPKGKFLNDPFAAGQLGCVINTAEVEMTEDAKKMIQAAKREGGSFAPLMLTKHAGPGLEHGKSSIGVLGGFKLNLGTEILIGRDCDKSVLNDCKTVEREAPEEFKIVVDRRQDK